MEENGCIIKRILYQCRRNKEKKRFQYLDFPRKPYSDLAIFYISSLKNIFRMLNLLKCQTL